MASNASSPRGGDSENSLEKIKRQLSSNSGRNFLQGPLLKRSETLRKWNERWVILDPTTGKMEYNGLPKYDGCCFYIGTPQKKDYFLCAETPGAAKAWVSTLQRRRSNSEQVKDQGFQGGSRNGDTWEKVGRIRDKFEYDKERRMSEKAFDPMNRGESDSRIQPFDAHKYFPESESDPNRNYR